MNRRGSYWINLLKGADYFVATLFGIPAGIYISGYAAFKKADSGNKFRWRLAVNVINWLFRDPAHCQNSMNNNLEDIKRYYL